MFKPGQIVYVDTENQCGEILCLTHDDDETVVTLEFPDLTFKEFKISDLRIPKATVTETVLSTRRHTRRLGAV